MVWHDEALPKLQKRAMRNVSILSLGKWESAGAALAWWGGRFSLGQPRGGGWARAVAVAACLCLGEDVSCCSRPGAGCSHPASQKLCDFTGSLTWLSGRVSCSSSRLVYLPSTHSYVLHVLKPVCISLDVAILQNPQACSCHFSFFLILNSPCCPHQSCQYIQCTACLYSLWSSRSCGYSREQPWATVTFWWYLPVSAHLTLTLFIVCPWATSVLLLSRPHSLS